MSTKIWLPSENRLHDQTEVKTNKNRSRNITWLNPPFSQSVKTNFGKMFLKLIKNYFPNHYRLHKIFNLNIIKLIYSCMSNTSSFIKQHNRIILSSSPNREERSCNCRNKDNCPLAGSCLKTCIVYIEMSSKIKHTYITAHLMERLSFEYSFRICEPGFLIIHTLFIH